MKTISKISCALLGAMLLSSICSGLVVGITEAVKLPLSTQSIQMIGGCMSSVGYVYFFQLFTKSMKKRNINEVSLGRKISIEQNRCAMACQDCGAVLFLLKKQWNYFS